MSPMSQKINNFTYESDLLMSPIPELIKRVKNIRKKLAKKL